MTQQFCLARVQEKTTLVTLSSQAWHAGEVCTDFGVAGHDVDLKVRTTSQVLFDTDLHTWQKHACPAKSHS